VKPRPPKNLTSLQAKKLWLRLFEASVMDEQGLLLLDELAFAYDRLLEAREAIAKHGLLLEQKTEHGDTRLKPNPAGAIERDARSAVIRIWRALGYDIQAPGEIQ
jgi:phage terminase small subunit